MSECTRYLGSVCVHEGNFAFGCKRVHTNGLRARMTCEYSNVKALSDEDFKFKYS